MKAVEIQPPNPIYHDDDYVSVFLAGSIEMGRADEWQRRLIEDLEDEQIIFFNPRRDDWDSSLEQSIDCKPFKEQVEWELNALAESDVIVMYFDPDTKSPITLLELGLFSRAGRLLVVCPDGYWKKGNVDVVCEKYNITQVEHIGDVVQILKSDD